MRILCTYCHCLACCQQVAFPVLKAGVCLLRQGPVKSAIADQDMLLIMGIVVVADAAYSLMQKKSLLFALNSNNALLQFVLEVNT